MTARRVRGAAVVRSIGRVATAADASGAPRTIERYVALDRMREQIDRVEWAPLRLAGAAAGGTRARPASPRLPHALLLHLAHAGRLASAGESRASASLADVSLADVSLADTPVRLDVGALAAFVGADPEGVVAALRALLHAGVLHAGGLQVPERSVERGLLREAERFAGGSAGTDTLPQAVALAPALLGPAPRCAALDWGALALATAGAPSAWVAAHVLAERLVLDEWTPMPRSALEHTLGCGVSGVRSALDRLTVAAVVERREQRGGVSAYRFTAALRAAPAATPIPASPAPAPNAPAPNAPPAVTPAAVATGVRLTVGGVELDVPAGLRVRVEIGADGMPQITLVPAATGPG